MYMFKNTCTQWTTGSGEYRISGSLYIKISSTFVQRFLFFVLVRPIIVHHISPLPSREKKIQYFRTLHWACLTFETVHITKKLQLSSSSLYKQRDFVLRLDLHVTILLFERGRQTDGYCALYKFLICPMQGGKPSWQPGISVSVYVHYLPRNVCDFRVVVQTNLRWTGDVSGLGKLITNTAFRIRRPFFHRENSLQNSLNLSLNVLHSWFGHCGAEKDVLPL